MNAENYFSQYQLLNAQATDYSVIESARAWYEIGESDTFCRPVEEYERNNEEIPICGEYAVLQRGALCLAVAKIQAVTVEDGIVCVNCKVVFS